MIINKKVLDVGCGHGDFTLKCTLLAKEIVGFDVTENFIKIGLENKRDNVSFIQLVREVSADLLSNPNERSALRATGT